MAPIPAPAPSLLSAPARAEHSADILSFAQHLGRRERWGSATIDKDTRRLLNDAIEGTEPVNLHDLAQRIADLTPDSSVHQTGSLTLLRGLRNP